MLDNINQHTVVTYTYNRRSRVLQLNQVLLILVYLRFINLANLVLIALAKRLLYFCPPDSNSCVTVA